MTSLIESQSRAAVMAAEDQRVFDALDAAAQQCLDKSHAAYGKHLRECPEPECAAAWVHGS
jgi:hypothetical protein